jgi:hypothetical protein
MLNTIYEIWGFHGSEISCCSILGYEIHFTIECVISTEEHNVDQLNVCHCRSCDAHFPTVSISSLCAVRTEYN